MRCRVVAIPLLLLALLTACGPSRVETERIRGVLATRAQALNNRNLPLYLSVVSSGYSHHGKDFSRLKDEQAAAFKEFEQVAYQAGEPSIAVKGERAEVAGDYRMKVIIRGKEMQFEGKERITLVKESGVWKISAGL